MGGHRQAARIEVTLLSKLPIVEVTSPHPKGRNIHERGEGGGGGKG